MQGKTCVFLAIVREQNSRHDTKSVRLLVVETYGRVIIAAADTDLITSVALRW